MSVDRRLKLPGLEHVDLMFRLRPGTWPGEPEEIVLGNKLFFPGPANVNDRHEAKPMIVFSNNGRLSTQQIREMTRRNASGQSYARRREIGNRMINLNSDDKVRQHAMEKMEEWLQGLLDNSSLCCFFGEDSDRNWAHYGSEHKGFGVAFERQTKFLFPTSLMRGHLIDDGGMFEAVAVPVHYSKIDQYPTIDLDGDRASSDTNQQIVDAGFYTKSEDWMLEREYRALRPDVAPSHQTFNESQMRAIIVTEHSDPALQNELVSLASQRARRLPVFRRKLVRGSYFPSYEAIA